MELLNMKEEMAERYPQRRFLWWWEKRNEILQLLMLEPTFALLDEIDSGLDIDALKVVSKGVNAMRGEGFGAMIIITTNVFFELHHTRRGTRDDGRSWSFLVVQNCCPFGTWRIRKTSWRTLATTTRKNCNSLVSFRRSKWLKKY